MIHLSKVMRPSMATLIHPFCLKSLMIACNWSIYPRLCGHQWPLITSICCKKYRDYPQPISMIYPWTRQNLYLWCNMDKGYAFRKMSVLGVVSCKIIMEGHVLNWWKQAHNIFTMIEILFIKIVLKEVNSYNFNTLFEIYVWI